MTSLAGPETAAHYERLAGSYDHNWSHNGAFLGWMAHAIASSLALSAADRIADVGCGTGLFTRRIRDLVRPSSPVLCVDPSAAMLAQLPADPGLQPLRASAEELARGRPASAGPTTAHGSLDAIIVKEAIHHVADVDRRWVIAGLADLLGVRGRLLVVMLPTRIEYPLFDAALERFESLQPAPDVIADHIRRAGLSASVTYHDFPLEIPKGRYLAMVRDRYMSLLATFDDVEIEAGLAEIDRRHTEKILSFPDRFAFVLGAREGNR
ncbi:trans-aconitate 2-methyltransferase [Frankia sp. Cj3]|uniref:class I SAM-dependent methyltransferase n=1 Tax=Frankia sp. Cj3 TaxID=2880976 RepID=UPI001EF49163|nr:class I SAM-dependent methyltransferase [Frankia sp. Cj3]